MKSNFFENRTDAARGKKRAAAAVLAGILFLVYLLKTNQAVSVYLAKSLSRPYRAVAGLFTSLFPFSVTEFLIAAAVGCGAGFLVAVVALCVKRRFRKLADKFLTLLLIVLSVLTLYGVTAQFDYERPAPDKPWLSSQIEIENYRVLVLKYAEAAENLAASLPKDENGFSVAPSFEETAKKMQKEVQKYAGGDYGFTVPRPKQVFFGWVMDAVGILGVTFAPTNEVSMNPHISDLDQPYYMAHELAHSLGIMSEREANIFAAHLTLASDDPWIRYSGYRALLFDLIRPIAILDAEKNYNYSDRITETGKKLGLPAYEAGVTDDAEYLKQILALGGKEAYYYVTGIGETEAAFREALGGAFRKDAEIAYYTPDVPEFLKDALSFFNGVGSWFNDLYLKSSGLEDGTRSYDTGGSVVLPPDDGEEDPTIVYSETVRIFLYLAEEVGIR